MLPVEDPLDRAQSAVERAHQHRRQGTVAEGRSGAEGAGLQDHRHRREPAHCSMAGTEERARPLQVRLRTIMPCICTTRRRNRPSPASAGSRRTVACGWRSRVRWRSCCRATIRTGQPDQINAALAKGDTLRVNHQDQDQVSVYLLCWTAFASANGTMNFRGDPYSWDKDLAARSRNAPRLRLPPFPALTKRK